MHNENHYAALIIDRGEIITRPVNPDATEIEDPYTLTIRPVNFNMNDLLDEAGIEMPLLEDTEGKGDLQALSSPLHPSLKPSHPFDYANVMKEDTEGTYAGTIRDDKPQDE